MTALNNRKPEPLESAIQNRLIKTLEQQDGTFRKPKDAHATDSPT